MNRAIKYINQNYHSLHKTLLRLEKKLVLQPELVDEAKPIVDIHQQMLQKNLSVQIHPTAKYCETHPDNKWHSKTEAWFVLEAEKGAGFPGDSSPKVSKTFF